MLPTHPSKPARFLPARFGLALASAAALALCSCGGQSETWVASGSGTVTVFVEQIRQNEVDKLDLLFMIDNSLSMVDKQQFLQAAVPGLLLRLVEPNCISQAGQVVQRVGSACPAGSRLEYPPMNDIHIGVITSSLGGRGKPCTPGGSALEDDRAHLVGSLDRGAQIPTFASLGFLAWDPTGESAQPASASGAPIAGVGGLTEAFGQMVLAAGEQGCSYESGLESWYRFLVDPEPPETIVLDSATGTTQAQGVDQTLLSQRAAFLRPDSMLVIVMLSDENDCSVIDYGQGWLVASESRLPRATSRCAENPNDKCCFSCGQSPSQTPAGCPGPLGSSAPDFECQKDAGQGSGKGMLGTVEDAASLRCWQAKRRFGFDPLFPISRYVDALTRPEVCARQTDASGTCTPKDNPLMSPSSAYPDLPARTDSSLIYLVGIVGVPWQDIATEETLSASVPALEFMDVQALSSHDRWPVMLGDPDASPPRVPEDPFMIESVDERSGAHPITMQQIVDSSSSNPVATINGHEVKAEPSMRDELQYACIFELPLSRDCTLPEYATNDPATKKGCDCRAGTEARNRPLCQPPDGGPAGTQQYFAKAYPGLRYLELLKQFGEQSVSANSIVASICPKFPRGEVTLPEYGYNPAMRAVIDRIKEKFKGSCLPRALELKEDKTPACQFVEATKFGGASTPDCNTSGREPLPKALETAILDQLEESGQCGAAPKPECRAGNGGFNLCRLKPAAGDPADPGSDYARCLTEPAPGITGYCYIDAVMDGNGDGVLGCLTSDGTALGASSAPVFAGGDCLGNPDLVRDCAPAMKRVLRFVSPADSRVPAKDSMVILACQSER